MTEDAELKVWDVATGKAVIDRSFRAEGSAEYGVSSSKRKNLTVVMGEREIGLGISLPATSYANRRAGTR
jgi:hypothetical protein